MEFCTYRLEPLVLTILTLLMPKSLEYIEEESGIIHVHVGTKIVEKRSLLYLKQFPNVLFTQHYAFFTQEAVESMVMCGLESIQFGLLGKENPYEV